jgi:hypothetical protein
VSIVLDVCDENKADSTSFPQVTLCDNEGNCVTADLNPALDEITTNSENTLGLGER